MKKELLERFYKEKIKIKLNIVGGRFFSGTILELHDDYLIFLDKYGHELPFDLNLITYVDILENHK